MKQLTLVLLCGLAILLSTISLNAQEQSIPTLKLPTFIDCGSSENINKLIERHGEIPFAEMNGAITIPPGNRMLQGKTILYINPQTGAYSMVMEIPQNYSGSADNVYGLEKCIIGFGGGFVPAITNKTSI